MVFQDAGAFVDRGARGQDIIDEQKSLAVEAPCAFKSAADIGRTCLVWQGRLRWRGTAAPAGIKIDTKPQFFSQAGAPVRPPD